MIGIADAERPMHFTTTNRIGHTAMGSSIPGEDKAARKARKKERKVSARNVAELADRRAV